MKRLAKSLSLTTTTIHTLQAKDLRAAEGGGAPRVSGSNNINYQTCTCSTNRC